MEMTESRELVERARKLVPHFECDDPWYSCPKATHGCENPNKGTACNCGADAENALRKELADALEAALEDAERLEWVLPLLSGADDSETERRTFMLGEQLLAGKIGRTAIDAARGKHGE